MRRFYLPAGIMVGRYELIRPIGAGGGGTVYEALDVSLGRRVALKVRQMPEASGLAKGVEARFFREARAAAQIRHPNVVSVFDFGVDGDLAFLVMELIEGENLAQMLQREGALGVAGTLGILLPILSAVAELHAHGVVHRDIKPANILLAKGGAADPKLADFGLSRFIEEASSITESGVALGTPGYMAPELLRSPREAGERSDQYALGVVLYECVTGTRPLRHEADGPDLSATDAEVARPSALDASLPDGLDPIVLRAVHREPQERFVSIDALAGALAPFAPEAVAVRWRADLAPSPASSAEAPRGEATTLSTYDGVAIAMRGDALVILWNVAARVARVQWMFDAADRFQSRCPQGFVVLLILLPSASPPDYPTMMECVKRARALQDATRRQATVAVGGGIWRAMVRHVHRAVNLPLHSRTGSRTISGTIEDGIARLLEKSSSITPSFDEIWQDVLALHEALDVAPPTLSARRRHEPASLRAPRRSKGTR